MWYPEDSGVFDEYGNDVVDQILADEYRRMCNIETYEAERLRQAEETWRRGRVD